MEGTPPLRGVPYPTFKCGQNVKIKNRVCFDFHILTAFKDRIGQAPKGPGALLIII